MKIDAHQHFWAVARGDYGWLTPELEPLYRDFTPADFRPVLEDAEVTGSIVVQAAPTVAETRYLLALAAENPFIKGVVGWVDFEAPDAAETVAQLAADPMLVGLRPMIQDIADDDWMLRADLTAAFEALIAEDLVFDALTFPRHLRNLGTLLDRHPDMRVVINHGSKPHIADRAFDDWAEDMKSLGRHSTAYVKLSGLVTEAGPNWAVEDLKPYVNHLLEHFGPARIIWGSDWPVCTLASSYERWCAATYALLCELDPSERADILGQNAVNTYKLNGV